jgi:hypothetical protein
MHPFSLEHGMKEKKGIHVSRTSIYKWQEQGNVKSGNVCILNMENPWVHAEWNSEYMTIWKQ